MFYLVLPAPTLTADLPNLRCLYKTTLAFQPPPDYGSGGWGFESLAARQTCRSEPIFVLDLLALLWEPGQRSPDPHPRRAMDRRERSALACKPWLRATGCRVRGACWCRAAPCTAPPRPGGRQRWLGCVPARHSAPRQAGWRCWTATATPRR